MYACHKKSNRALLREIHEAAVSAMRADASCNLEAVIVQTRGALGVLSRLSKAMNSLAKPIQIPSCEEDMPECRDSTPPVEESRPPSAKRELRFPSGLLLSPEDLSLPDLIANRKLERKSRSTEGLSDLKSLFHNRVRQGREERGRRKSFSLGVAAHEENAALEFEDMECLEDPTQKAAAINRFRNRRHFSFTPLTANCFEASTSAGAVSAGVERWPESISMKLTNGQSVESRLKMFRHFATLMKLAEENVSDLSRSPPCSPSTTNSGASTPVPIRLPPAARKNLRLVCGAFTIPRPGKPHGGEDAFFHNLDTDSFSFAGVADGVGEWGEYDCCPKQFACELMNGSRDEAAALPNQPEEAGGIAARARALRVLRAGFERATSIDGCFGSATSLVAGMDASGETLGLACLGDSSCIVLRRSSQLFRHMTIAKRTREQQHFFNCPYQLSKVPELKDIPALEKRGLYALMKIIKNMKQAVLTDSPEMSSLYDVKVKEGDLIILGTDGLFDNLFDNEIIHLASLCLSPYESKLFFDAGGVLDRTEEFPNPTLDNLTDAWVKGGLPHPLALEPPIATPTFGIATPPGAIARGLAEAAFYRSLDPKARTPFAKAARNAGCQILSTGGKMDDITVVAAWVVSR